MKRFYEQAEAVPLDAGGYGVALDGRRVRTPAGRPLALPSRALAAAVAGEWSEQGEWVEPRTMADDDSVRNRARPGRAAHARGRRRDR